MELIPIRLILDNSGNLVDNYTALPVVNQYATNYKLEVAFKNDMQDIGLIKVVFNINGKSTPARLLAPTLDRIKLDEDVYSDFSYSYQLTQYETQFYQDTLSFTVYIKNANGDQIANIEASVPMSKQNFNKLTPANLEEDESSLTSIAKAIYSLEQAIEDKGIADTERFETKYDAQLKLESANQYTDQEVSELSTAVFTTVSNLIENSENYVINSLNNTIEDKITIHNLSNNSHQDIRDLIKNIETGSTDVYTKEETRLLISQSIESLIDSAPGTLDSLKELATAIGNDPNFAVSITKKLAEKVNKSDYDSVIPGLTADIEILNTKIETKLDKASIPTLRIWG